MGNWFGSPVEAGQRPGVNLGPLIGYSLAGNSSWVRSHLYHESVVHPPQVLLSGVYPGSQAGTPTGWFSEGVWSQIDKGPLPWVVISALLSLPQDDGGSLSASLDGLPLTPGVRVGESGIKPGGKLGTHAWHL